MLKELESRLIEAVIYDQKEQQLKLHLRNGQRREFIDVPEHVYNELLSAKSAGQYYKKTIKPNFMLAP